MRLATELVIEEGADAGGSAPVYAARPRIASMPFVSSAALTATSADTRVGHRTGPSIQGANSSSPRPWASLLVHLPLATASTSSKMARPTSWTGVPSRTTPASRSMSSSIRRYRDEVVAILMHGEGLHP